MRRPEHNEKSPDQAPPSLDDESEFCRRLLEFDEALRQGKLPADADTSVADGDSNAETALGQAADCLRILHRVAKLELRDGLSSTSHSAERTASRVFLASGGGSMENQQIGRFQIAEELGSGGFGIVYRA